MPSEKYHVEFRDARGVVIGEHNVVYQCFLSERYRPLAEHFISFDDLIAKRTADFTGRTFLDARLDAFLERHDRGYFLLEGQPGIGKTAWAAHLVRERKALHHFNVAALGVTRPDQARENLCTQIIARHDLGVAYLPPDAGRDGCCLDRVLHQASGHLIGGKLLIVVDALDEVQMEAHGANVLYLPASLPAGVYFVLTQRPQPLPLETAPGTPLELLTLRAGMPENQADLRAYLRQQADKPEIARRLAERGIPRNRFIEALVEHSAGNFMYLAYLLPDITAGQYDPLALDRLPEGLRGYYERFWQELQAVKGEGREAWSHFYKPVVALLAAAREPVSAAWLARILELDPDQVADFALTRWSKFLQHTTTNGEVLWRLYHASFGNFLEEKLDGARQYHAQIADYYRRNCGSDWSQLAHLDGGYAVRHFAAHLATAERWEELNTLVNEGPQARQIWAHVRFVAEGSHVGYLADLHLAWRQFDKASSGDRTSIKRQVRCALVASSVRTLGRIPPALLEVLVRRRVPGWTPANALGYARQVLNEWERAAALAALVTCLPTELYTEALAIARDIKWEAARGRAVAALCTHLPVELAAEALAAVHTIEGAYYKADIIAALSQCLPAELWSQALSAVRQIHSEGGQAHALAALAQCSPAGLWAEILATASALKYAAARIEALAALIPHLPRDQQARVWPETLDTARSIWDAHERAEALGRLVPHLPIEQQPLVLAEALSAVHSIRWQAKLPGALAIVVPHLPNELVADALSVASSIGSCADRARALIVVFNRLPSELLAQAFSTASAVKDADARARSLAALAPFLPEALVAEALVVASAIGQERARAYALAALVPYLPHKLLLSALAATRTIISEEDRVEALVALARYLPTKQYLQVNAELEATARRIRWRGARADVLVALARYLPVELLTDLVDAARLVGDSDDRAKTLATLAPYLPGRLQASILEDVYAIDNPSDRAEALAAMISRLPKGLSAGAIEIAVKTAQMRNDTRALSAVIPNFEANQRKELLDLILKKLTASGFPLADNWWDVLVALVPHLSERELSKTLDAACRAQSDSDRARLLAALALHLPNELLTKALSIAKSITDEDTFAHALVNLAPRLYGSQAIEALTAARTIEGPNDRIKVLVALAPSLATAEREQVTEEIYSLFRGNYPGNIKIDVLVDLAPCLSVKMQSQVLLEILPDVRAREGKLAWVRVLSALASHHAFDLLPQALADACAIKNERNRACALATLAPRLPADLIAQALSATSAIKDEDSRASALTALAPRLPTHLLVNALALASAMEHQSARAEALAALVSRWTAWAQHARPAAVAPWPATLQTLAIRRRPDLLVDLRALPPIITALGDVGAITETAHAILDVGHWWP